MADDLDFVVNASGLTDEDATPGAGPTVSKEGRFHFICNAITKPDVTNAVPYLQLTLEALAGTEESEVGKSIYKKVYLARRAGVDENGNIKLEELNDSGTKTMCQIANALGLISEAQMGNPHLRIPWSQAETRQMIAEVQSKEYEVKDRNTGKPTGELRKFYEIPFGSAWRVDHEEVKGVPKNHDAITLMPPPLGEDAQDGGVDVSDL